MQCIKKSQYLLKPFRSFGGNINVKADLSNYGAKAKFKNISHFDTLSFALKRNLASLKNEVDKLDIEKIIPVPVEVCKLSNAVKIAVVRKTLYDKFVAKVTNIDSSGLVLKTKYNEDKAKLEKKFLVLVNIFKNQTILLK